MRSANLTPNQVVAYNVRRARRLHNWTQEQAAERLEPYLGERWSKASFSVAERSVDHAERIRQFTADDIMALCAAFDLPVAFFFTPPPRGIELIAPPAASERLSSARALKLATSSPDKRVAALMEERYRDLEGFGIEVEAEGRAQVMRDEGVIPKGQRRRSTKPQSAKEG